MQSKLKTKLLLEDVDPGEDVLGVRSQNGSLMSVTQVHLLLHWEKTVTVHEYSYSESCYSVMKHFYLDGNDLLQDDRVSIQRVTACFEEYENDVNHLVSTPVKTEEEFCHPSIHNLFKHPLPKKTTNPSQDTFSDAWIIRRVLRICTPTTCAQQLAADLFCCCLRYWVMCLLKSLWRHPLCADQVRKWKNITCMRSFWSTHH